MDIRALADKFECGEISKDEFIARISYCDLGYAKVDTDRVRRTGYPEVIYGSGKTPEQIRAIFLKLLEGSETVICTRADKYAAEAVLASVEGVIYHERARVLVKCANKELVGLVAVASGGTADEAVAEEAVIILESFGSRTERLYDVGVAGVHRLFDKLDILRAANCIVAVAGMEGALPSVISGLVSVPVIAVPTSVGYGANLAGVTTLLAMLSSCAAGISVVNIDNGFGAAYIADMINKAAISS